jgi:hypothetical protein
MITIVQFEYLQLKKSTHPEIEKKICKIMLFEQEFYGQ